jgi:hypothetical protein
MDVDSIRIGEEYENPIQKALDSCEVALVLIGSDWVGPTGVGDKRRIDEEDDWVRREVAAALSRRDVKVIPILVEGTTMPSRQELPPNVARIAKIEACELSNRRWKFDFERLCKSMQDIRGEGAIKRLIRHPSRGAKAGAAAALAVAVAVGVLLATGTGSSGSSCTNQTIPPDVRQELSTAQGTKQAAVEGTVFYGACSDESWAIAQFPGGHDGVFRQTGFTWTKVGSIAAAKCKVPTDLRAAWSQGGC